MRRINGKLIVADRSGALGLLAHNPKVAAITDAEINAVRSVLVIVSPILGGPTMNIACGATRHDDAVSRQPCAPRCSLSTKSAAIGS